MPARDGFGRMYYIKMDRKVNTRIKIFIFSLIKMA